jgi:ADP-ribosylglycohydrolase
MALSVVHEVVSHGAVDPARLIADFAVRFEIGRGYGAATRDLLHDVRLGVADPDAAAAMFGGRGSFGNGAAMRVAPLGAYFAADLDRVALEAERSAITTHRHREGIDGAIAVAIAAALAVRSRGSAPPGAEAFLDGVVRSTPPGRVRDAIGRAVGVPSGAASSEAAAILGSGSEISALDTVPFALWAVAGSLDSFEETFWRTVAGLGDRDTTCAIACGISAARVGRVGVPDLWRDRREPLPSLTRRA